LPFYSSLAIVFGKFISKLSRDAQDQLAESNTIVEETLQGIANVKAFVNEAFEAGRYDKTLQRVVAIAIRGLNTAACLELLLFSVCSEPFFARYGMARI
jgi:ABC-type multidrug transport system fused ATPase/permease subunit